MSSETLAHSPNYQIASETDRFTQYINFISRRHPYQNIEMCRLQLTQSDLFVLLSHLCLTKIFKLYLYLGLRIIIVNYCLFPCILSEWLYFYRHLYFSFLHHKY